MQRIHVCEVNQEFAEQLVGRPSPQVWNDSRPVPQCLEHIEHQNT